MSGRCTAAERDLRTAVFVKWVRQGITRQTILGLADARWQLKERTVDAYLKRARELVEEETRAGIREEVESVRRSALADASSVAPTLEEVPSRDELVLQLLNMLFEQYHQAKANGDVSGALKAAKQLAEVGGLNWSDRDNKDVGDDVARQQKAAQAFWLLLRGASDDREARGLEAIEQPEDEADE